MTTENAPLNEDREFAKVVSPLVEHLKEKHHPHVIAIVTHNSAELLEGLKYQLFTERPTDVKSIESVETPLEFAHGIVHDISYNIGQGKLGEAKDQLKKLDMLLHDEIAKSTPSKDLFNTLSDIIRP